MDYYPLPLRDRLSRVRVPLRAGDEPIVVDLQACVDEAYAEGHYAELINYGGPPVPALSAADAAWAADRVAVWRAAV